MTNPDMPGWDDLTPDQKGWIADIEVEAFWRGYNYELPGAKAAAAASPSPERRDEVLVEGTYFPRADLPRILGNFIRSSDQYARDAKAARVELADLKAAVVEMAPAPDADRDALARVRADTARRVLRWLEPGEDDGAGIWMQAVHDGDTGNPDDWATAYDEARAALSATDTREQTDEQ